MTTVPADAVISAVGEKVDDAFFQRIGIDLDAQGRPEVTASTCQTQLPQVYVIGDGLRGPSTVVEAIADAAKAAEAILRAEGIWANGADTSAASADILNFRHCEAVIRSKKSNLQMSMPHLPESERCLECAAICENCAEVCPNRANAAIVVPAGRCGKSFILTVYAMRAAIVRRFALMTAHPTKKN